MSATTAPSALWSQELEVHWPQAWRFLAGRDLLLEMFTPQIFAVTDDTLYLRYDENQDLRVSANGMHIRILSRDQMDGRAADVLVKVLKVIEPRGLADIRATFSHVRPVKMNYDEARRLLAAKYYGPWIQDRDIKDFALLWDENADPAGQAKYSMGVVDRDELLERVAQAAGSHEDALRQWMPAWMKVRLPAVSIFMESRYIAGGDTALDSDLGQVKVPQIWWQWREQCTRLFNDLTMLATTVQEGEVS